jgi:hypothetical protein
VRADFAAQLVTQQIKEGEGRVNEGLIRMGERGVGRKGCGGRSKREILEKGQSARV